MKNANKCFAAFLVAVIFLQLCACGKSGDVKVLEKPLYEHGCDVIELMVEMVSNETYLQTHTGSSEILELLAGVATGDFAEPQKVYAVTAGSDFFDDHMEPGALDELSEDLLRVLKSKLMASQMVQVNGYGSAACVAAASICTAGKTFVDNRVNEDVVYVYTYENAVPAAVSFTVGENGAVSASGTFIIYDGIHLDTAEDIRELFGFAVNVEDVEKEAA